MANKIISPGSSGNLQTDLGGAPSGGDNVYINEGSVTYSTVPDWSGTALGNVLIGPGFRGNIGTDPWKIQATLVDISFGGQYVVLSPGASTIGEIIHKPSQGGKAILQGDASGVVTTLRTWGPATIEGSLPTLTNLYLYPGADVLVRTGTNAFTLIESEAGSACTLERDYAAANVRGMLTLNSTGITPAGTTTVFNGGVLKIVKSGTWATTTAVLHLKSGAVLDITEMTTPVVLEDLTLDPGCIIRKRLGGIDYSVAGSTTTNGGGAKIEYV